MSYEDERGVIGALLIDNNGIDHINFLQPEMFQDDLFSKIFSLFKNRTSDQALDVVYVFESVRGSSIPDEIIKSELAECIRETISSTAIKSYAIAVWNEYRARMFHKAVEHVKGTPQTIDGDIESVIQSLELIRRVDTSGAKILPQIVEENEDNYFRENKSEKIQMGLPKLDDILGGLEGGDLIIIGARPAVGKSAFASQITLHFAESQKRVGYFNLEMQESQVYERFVSSISEIDITRIRRAIKFQNDEERRYREANAFLKKKNNVVISTGAKKISEIRAEARLKKYDVIIVDYLQLVKPDVRYGSNRYAEVGAISHAIKALAMEMNIPVIGLCQLNRVSEAREDKEPTMGELRESGDFEQDASVILLLWNTNKDNRSEKCIKVEKQRQGKTGKIKLKFDGGKMRFTEIEDDLEVPFDDEADLVFE